MGVFLIAVVHILFVTGFTLRILLRDGLSSSARLAWFIVLVMFPFVGIVAYFLFGEVDLGHSAKERHQKIFNEINQKAKTLLGKKSDLEKHVPPIYQGGFKYAASINGFHAVPNNHAELIKDEIETRKRIVADIDTATDHVHVLYYIWLTDTTGTKIAEALMRAAQRGVTCRAMADAMGSRGLINSKLWPQMKEAGVQVSVALPYNNIIKTLFTSRIDLRNHRKITVIDGNITYCGSQNCADPEFSSKPKYAPWVDIMLRIEGPVVAQNQLLFASDWMLANNTELDAFLTKPTEHKGGFVAQIMGDGPTERGGSTPQLFANIIQSAQSELVISSPYFVPDATVVSAICGAAYRGVKVSIIFPNNNDSWIVAAASQGYYKTLLIAGVKIHEFKGGLLHAKTLTVDGKLSFIGSSNMDLRSFDLNYENNILLYDESMTQDILMRQQDYIKRAIPVTIEQVKNWSYVKRIKNNVIATIGPVL